MITKASELLEAFIKKETEKLSGIKMPHMPTLGSAYEEITKQGIDEEFVIPNGLDLKVVSGFVSINGELQPEQIDCMLVHGTGEKYGLSEQYIYDIEKILCIFEVKKTLRKADCNDAMRHLARIRSKFAEYFEHKLINCNYVPDVTLASKNYSRLTGKIAPKNYAGIHNLSEGDGMLYYILVQESLAPISIIHGYDGYKKESGFRNAFVDILEESKERTGSGIGIPSFPSLITSNQYCLVKATGIPFLAKKNNEWTAVFSTRYNSAKLILELIWTKISFYFGIEMPWGDDLQMENIKPLLMAKVMRVGDNIGWMYSTSEYSEKMLIRTDDVLWEPAHIGNIELSAIKLMAAYGGVLPVDSDIDAYFRSNHGMTIAQVCEKLTDTMLFMSNEQYIRPVNDTIHVISLDDNTGYVSAEKNKFDLWCSKNNIQNNYFTLVIL
ncbi:DUF6602 domain-containing protein [Edwardsiella tarda]|uniref:DUF6602 domain-containing protein n=1 Tax=Edwardsiella tarda TaxID=636 RepID=UPI003D2EEE28